ncbi:MAG: hypothetical protein WD271_15150 [Acidimicrobiia bacterium]
MRRIELGGMDNDPKRDGRSEWGGVLRSPYAGDAAAEHMQQTFANRRPVA